MIAAVLALSVYAGLCVFLIFMVWRVYGAPPLPDWIIDFYYWKWRGTLNGFFTVRYEEDEDGLWQIVEEYETGNRYRVNIYDAERNYKW